MRKLRGNLTYANVISTLALFLAISGGAAYAASLGKNSVGTKQLKNGAVTEAKIANGAVTGPKVNLATLGSVPNATHAESATNAKSAENATHATNAENANHATSAEGATDAERAADADQLGGIPASHYVTATSTLASGQTETGIVGAAAPEGNWGVAAVDFVPKLAAEPAHIEDVRTSTNEHCPGPRKAAAGYLCIYEGWNYSMTFEHDYPPYEGSPAEGTDLYWKSSAKEGNVRAEWAYTAP